MAQDLSLYKVPETPCYSCPFEGKEPISLSSDGLAYYREKLLSLESQHLCHSQKRLYAGAGAIFKLKCFVRSGYLTNLRAKRLTEPLKNTASSYPMQNPENPCIFSGFL